ncbi:ubiquitin carboxyl-terminal hydrolase 35 isoform X2 [Aethina tumida]|nr:ubiquitin carboxyl-terminal hydrolase 35 isoform X2 [Aethina tumida]XP_019870958.2 ubiquitin carboxyl-terminal hydrolase 35 isoform X2 [Aethina tumida]
MAVKQKISECVEQSGERRLQNILRVLQDLRARDVAPQDKSWTSIVPILGTIQVPSNPQEYTRFICEIHSVREILTKECSKEEVVFFTLKSFYDEISKQERQLSPAMSIVLQLLNPASIPNAVRYILDTGYPDQNLERALLTLCTWLTKWTWTDNLGPLVLAFMQGLEAEHHYDILVEVTVATIDQLFKLLILPDARVGVEPVVMYMLSRIQHSPEAFHRVIPHIPCVLQMLSKEKSESSLNCLQNIVGLCLALMDHFPNYPSMYEPLKLEFRPYCPKANYKSLLECRSWIDVSGSTILRPIQCKVGLNNLGNTCYMNSVLQALFMTKTFRNELLLYHQEATLLTMMQALFALLQHSKRSSLSPTDILNLSRPPGFVPGHQHDSSEFLGYLLDTLHEQEKNIASGDAGDVEMSCLMSTIVQQSFGGRSVTVSKCDECSTKSEREDNFRELQLSFPGNCENQSVQTLLNYYFQTEKLSGDNQYYCDICGGLTDGERVTKILEHPQRLILTLKHFKYDPVSQQRTKLLQKVELDEFIQLETVQYKLYAAVIHFGSSVDSGHYYTFARDSDDWYKFNDCSVVKTSAEDLCRLRQLETPYILFYCRQDCPDPENLPRTLLSNRLQLVLSKDLSEYEIERKKPLKSYNTKQNSNDEPPPPGCGGGGFNSNNSNMFVC